MKRILITGAAGFFGARIARRAISEGMAVLGVDRSPSPIRLNAIGGQFEYRELDLRAAGKLEAAAAAFSPDTIVHAAAPGVLRGAAADIRMLVETNVLVGLEVARAAGASAASVVWIGSCFEYRPSTVPVTEQTEVAPVSDYAFAKVLGREAFLRSRSSAVRSITLRPFHLFGPGEDRSRLVPMALLAPLGRGENRFGDPALVRDFVFVDDAAWGALLAAEQLAGRPELSGRELNLATGVGTSLAELTRVAAEVVGRGGFDFHFSGEPPRPGYDPQILVGRADKAAELLGWRAETLLEQGLRRMAEWMAVEDAGSLP